LLGQGATEYLVLLAVVLIVALVSVALLGFFPGMATDAQIAQSQAYWRSAQPIQVIETVAAFRASGSRNVIHLQLRNSGAYPIRITGVTGSDGAAATQFYGSSCGLSGAMYDMANYTYIAPGEEAYFSSDLGAPCQRQLFLQTSASTGQFVKADTVCENSNSTPGTASIGTFGFNYVEYIEGQQLAKKQAGKPLIIKCRPPV
jgi:hypothetical protein